MSAEAGYFLDTNVLVYSFSRERGEAAKRERARGLIADALAQGSGIISWQVVQEFLHVALHKWQVPMSPADAREYLQVTLLPLCRVFPSSELWASALGIQASTGFRWYDSLIVAAAQHSGARILYSEDLQHDRRLGRVRIVNPFTAGA